MTKIILFEKWSMRFALLATAVTMIGSAAPALLSAQEIPQSHRTGEFRATFTERDPRSDIGEANRRFDEGARFNPAAYNIDLGSESYEIYVPENYNKSEKYGLVVWISAQEGGRVPRNYKSLMDKHRLIWIGANKSGNGRTPYWERAILAVDGTFNMKRLYSIDPDRIYVSGPSGGGRMSSMAAILYCDVFTGGGYYLIGCNYMKDMPIGTKQYLPGFWLRPDPRIIAVARTRRFAMLTGSQDTNQPGTKGTAKGYEKDGFKYVTYLEQPELGHRMPSAEWFEKGLLALDAPLLAGAKEAFKVGEQMEAQGDLLNAYKGYDQAVTHGHGLPFYDSAKLKRAAIKPDVASLSLTRFSELGPDATSEELRQFVRDWHQFPGGDSARKRANEMGAIELAAIGNLKPTAQKSARDTFLSDWSGFSVHDKAIGVFSKEAAFELEEIRKVKNLRQRARKLRSFGKKWSRGPVVDLAFIDYSDIADAQLAEINEVSNLKKRTSMLKTLIRDFPNTTACKQAKTMLGRK